MICDPLWQSSSHNNIKRERTGKKTKGEGKWWGRGCVEVEIKGKKAKQKQKLDETHTRDKMQLKKDKSGYQNTMRDWNAGRNEKV